MLKRLSVGLAITAVAIAAYAGLVANMPGLTPALDSRVIGMNSSTGNEGAFQVSDLVNLASTDYSFTVTGTGLTATVTATMTATVVDNVVIMNIPALTGTSNTTTFTLTGLPAAVTPATARVVPIPASDNGGAAAYGSASIGTNGVISISPTPTVSGTFTDTGAKAITALSVSYTR